MSERLKNGIPSLNKWLGKPYHILKASSTTEKGNAAEDFLYFALKDLCYSNIEINNGRRGSWDVSLEDKLFFEVKLATEDQSGGFQFNEVRYDINYTHLFCLGATPEKLYYTIIAKDNLNSYNLVAMAKGSNATFKLSLKPNRLKSFIDFPQEINSILRKF